jgi:hypothetical protein
MKLRLMIVCTAALIGLEGSRPLLAHHSGASYDDDHQISLTGTVNNFEWTNPHVFIYLDVKDENGAVAQWRVEGNSPNMLARAGWKKEMIKAGDQITVNGAPAKNKAPILRLISLTLANGVKFDGQGFKIA